MTPDQGAGVFPFSFDIQRVTYYVANQTTPVILTFDPNAIVVNPVSGSDSNPGTLALPFQTLEKAQTAARTAADKTIYLRAGTYTRTASLNLTAADNGQTWSFFPSDGVNTAILDGGGTTDGIFNISGTQNLTINGLKIQNPLALAINSVAQTGITNLTIENCDIGFNHSTNSNLGYGGFAPILVVVGTNATVANNYVHDALNSAIGCFAFNNGESINGTVIKNNVVERAVQQISVGGAVYVNCKNSGATAGTITITNNYVKDYGLPGIDTAVGIFLDANTSNATVNGNIIAPTAATSSTSHGQQAYFVNGGSNNAFSGNIVDLGTSSFVYAGLWASPSASASFTSNIVISRFAGSQNTSYAGAAVGNTYAQLAGAPGPFQISNNLYHNYGGSTEVTTGSITSDSNPVHADPQLSGFFNYTLASTSPAFSAPVAFPPIVGGFGPPGFAFQNVGQLPSYQTTAETIGGGTIATAALGPQPTAPSANVGTGWTLVKNWHFGTGGTIKNNSDLDGEFNYHDEFNSFQGAGFNYGSLTIATSSATAQSGQPIEDPTRPVRTFSATEMQCILQAASATATVVSSGNHDCVNGSIYSKFSLPNAGSLLGQDLLWEFVVRLCPVSAYWSAIWNEGNAWNLGPEVDVYESYGWDHGSQGNNFNAGNFHSDIVTQGGANGSTSNTSLQFVNFNSFGPSFQDGSHYHRFNFMLLKNNSFNIWIDDNLVNFGTYFWTVGGLNGGTPENMFFQHDFAWGFNGNLGTVNGVPNQGMSPSNYPVSNFVGKSYGIQYSRVYLR